MSETEPEADIACISAYADLIRELRRLQDAASMPGCRAETMSQLARAMGEWAHRLGPCRPESGEWTAARDPLPSRGKAMCPPFVIEHITKGSVSGRVEFGRHYLGGNGAAHGGAIAVVFDEMFGGLINRPGGPRARTAYLRVDYLQVAPLEKCLRAEANVTQREGRKNFVFGRLYRDQVIVAEAEGLLITLNPGQV